MQVVGSKLSKHVLGMKFMRKTKDNLDQDSTEQSHRKHFGVKVDVQKKSDLINQPSVNADKNRKPSTSTTFAASDPSSTVTAVIEETSSYSQCLGYSFGRFSFGGFNPTVEYNVKRGIWRTGFNNVGQDQSDEDDESKEKDISDSEMAELRANVIGSMERRFKTKKQRGGQDADRDNPILEETSGTSSKRKGRQPNWKKKNAEEQQQGSSSSSWFNGHGQPLKKSSSSADHKSPPQKKRKFMKPSDD